MAKQLGLLHDIDRERRSFLPQVRVMPEPARGATRAEPETVSWWPHFASLCIVILAIVVPIGWRTWARLRGPDDGISVAPANPHWGTGVTVAKVRGAPGVHRGDVVVAVDGIPLSTWVGRPAPAPGVYRRAGDHLRYEVLRHGQHVDVDVVLRRPSLTGAVSAEGANAPLLVAIVGVAGFVFVRRPDDRAARVLLLVAALIAAGAAVSPYLDVVDLAGGRGIWPFVSDRIARALMWGALLHFALVFPRPCPALVGRRWLLGLAYAGPFLLYAAHLAFTLPGATTPLRRADSLLSISRTASYVYPVVVVAVMGAVYLGLPDGASRLRLKWVLLAFSVSAALSLALGQLPGVQRQSLVSEDLLPLVFLPCPLAVGVAVLRYRIFDIEVILKRSLVYGALTGFVLAVYLASLAVLERVLGSHRGLVALLASGLVAAWFPVLRRQLQQRVGRLIHGERDDPYEVVSRLGQRLEATADPAAILPGMIETLGQTLRLPYVAVELRDGVGELVASASAGEPEGPVERLPLVHRGQPLGELLFALGRGAEPLGPSDRRLVTDVTRQVAVTAHGVVLFAALQRSLEKTVVAREEERRRLRRDLHDGLGPTLAAAALQLEVARSLLGTDLTAADSLLARLCGQVQTATADVRRIVDDLRPADLDQLGLVSAIEQRAAHFSCGSELAARAGVLEVAVRADGDLARLTAAVEVAAFRIALEALNNASRHGGATTCAVELHVNEATFEMTVTDNGCGLPASMVAGVGTQSMRERAAELGGLCEIRQGDHGGTVVDARFPLR